MSDTFSQDLVKVLVNYLKQVKENINMASFNDYLKEIDNLKQQLKTDRDNLKLRIEQLYNFKGFYGDNFKYLTGSLHSALNSLEECVDMMEGWIPVLEKGVPEDMIFKSEIERKAEAFEEILELSHKEQWPEEFGEDVYNIIDKYRETGSIKTDPELDKEPEDIPEEPKQETIFDDSKNGVEGFNEFLKKLK